MQPHGTPCWIDIQTDVSRAKDFYGAVMGWTFKPVVGAAGWVMGMDRDQPVAAIGPGEPRDWLVFLHVSDIESATEAMVAAGGDLAVPPGDVGKLGKAAIFDDPGGTPVALWQPGTHKGFTITGNPARRSGLSSTATRASWSATSSPRAWGWKPSPCQGP